jgi:Coenzyme PQQ synthesis protein D (PqqD)
MILPQARQEQLLVRVVADETVIYDLTRGKVHCLNRTAALVWRRCDGRTTVAEVFADLATDLGQPAAEEVVLLALEQLSRRHLLLTEVAAPVEEHRTRRREVLKQLAAALVALPVIMSLAAPASAQMKSHHQ